MKQYDVVHLHILTSNEFEFNIDFLKKTIVMPILMKEVQPKHDTTKKVGANYMFLFWKKIKLRN